MGLPIRANRVQSKSGESSAEVAELFEEYKKTEIDFPTTNQKM